MFPLQTHAQAGPHASPHPPGDRLYQESWKLIWRLLCRWTPKPLNPWRLWVLRRAGAVVEVPCYVDASARIFDPRRLVLRRRSCLGERAEIYNLAPVELCEASTVAQGCYLCTGTHDFSAPSLNLQTAPIRIGPGAFLGARVLVLPGVSVGANTVVGAGAVLSRDTDADAIWAGNPARRIRDRPGGPGRRPD